MKSKLTLALSEKTILEAKQMAKDRHTTVSALFAESLHHWRVLGDTSTPQPQSAPKDMEDLLGILSPKAAFDARSSRIREKHG